MIRCFMTWRGVAVFLVIVLAVRSLPAQSKRDDPTVVVPDIEIPVQLKRPLFERAQAKLPGRLVAAGPMLPKQLPPELATKLDPEFSRWFNLQLRTWLSAELSRQLEIFMPEATVLVRADSGRQRFAVSGAGLAVAILDTGIYPDHDDFKNGNGVSRIIKQLNFTADNKGNRTDALDGLGHGTNVSGVISACCGDHKGIAPDSNIVAIKVIDNLRKVKFSDVGLALQWVLDEGVSKGVSVVNMSFADESLSTDDSTLTNDDVRDKIVKLRAVNVPVVVAAGNGYQYTNGSAGMAYPAILRETISVGAVYDGVVAPKQQFGYVAYSTAADRITPFSKRLHSSVSTACETDLFAPGSLTRSAGLEGPQGESIQQGTSQAAPIVTGAILLLQEFYRTHTGKLPTVDLIERALRESAVSINDGDDEDDDVPNTGLDYRRVDVDGALGVMKSLITAEVYEAARRISEGTGSEQ